jgi:DNA-binding SARP family transcriptional activator
MVRRPSVAAVTEPTRVAPLRAAVRVTADSRQAPPDRSSAANALRHERAPVILSKIQPPHVRSSTLSRQRLLERLTDAVGSRLTLVVAEAGYGKTTLLADFSSRASVRCLWYKLDSTDADPITWTNYLIAAVREVDPSFGAGTLSLLAQVGPGGPPESAFVASLLGELPRLGEAPTVIVLDDFHAVDDSRDAHGYVARLIKDAPPWLHFVISSRRRPPLELGRLAAMGELVDISTDDLRFTADETARLFADGYGIALEPDVLRDLEARTQGWVASLQLFHGSVRGRPSTAVRALAKSLSGATNPIYDFLAQEVLNNLPEDLEEFLVRVALLDRIVSDRVPALFAESESMRPDEQRAHAWIEEADRLGLLTRTSQTSSARHLHPLLREFLVGTLRGRHSEGDIRSMHLRVAKAVVDTDPLTASRHYIEGGDQAAAMKCLGSSVMLTMGSGQWGLASSLIDRLDATAVDPAVAAIRARRHIDDGDFASATQLLGAVDLARSPAEVRAVFRHARLYLGWRAGDRDLMYTTLREIQGDPQTPGIMRDISQNFIDASPLAPVRVSLPTLAERLSHMAHRQRQAGHQFFAAISLHNAAVAYMNAGDFEAGVQTGRDALEAFERLPFPAPERFSTHSILATMQFELGNRETADEHFARATHDGDEFADVAAELALTLLATGDRKNGGVMLARAESLVRQGRSDAVGSLMVEGAKSFRLLPSDSTAATLALASSSVDGPLDFGHLIARQTIRSLAYLLAGDPAAALSIAEDALEEARELSARRAEMRLAVIVSLARGDTAAAHASIADAAALGELALLELADALADHFDLLGQIPGELEESLARWPERWRPALRRQLEKGYVPSGRAAAILLDRFGDASDVGRLRAYARAYRHRGRLVPLGHDLARRVSPRLDIRDLGRVSIVVGDRTVGLAAIRRKPASLLMYLVTRPAFSANREQVLDELWPETDPSSGSNSLNQTLYFLRRELDPWYEDDFSVDYIAFQGELIWLDPALVMVESVSFFGAAQELMRKPAQLDAVIDVLVRYRGPFAPEFEYEEWAMAWRSRVHATFLELASRTLERAIREGDLEAARDIAVYCLEVEPDNPDVERRLIWLYWHLGARAAAATQHDHLMRIERSDGVDPTPLEELVRQPLP